MKYGIFMWDHNIVELSKKKGSEKHIARILKIYF